MFNIPELDLLISRLLDRSDLAIATRVRSDWHSGLAVYVWTTVPKFKTGSRQHNSFYTIVLEDFMHCKQTKNEEQKKKDGVENKREEWVLKGEEKSARVGGESQNLTQQAAPPPTPHSVRLPILSKFGGLIQRIDHPTNLVTALTTPPTGTAITTTSDLPSGLDLFQHAISKFTGITELHLQEGFYNSDRLYKLLSPTMGTITHLTITCNNNGKDLRSLERLRSFLESTDRIDTLVLSIGNIIAEPASSAAITSKPTVLRLINLGRKLDTKAAKALSWLWQSCGDVKELELQAIDSSAMQQMPTSIRRMTVLTVIILEIRCGQTAEVGRDAVQVIIQYAATLKTLHICRVEKGTEISPILASCGNLEEFVTIKNRRFGNVRIPEVKARELLEKQEDGSLWPWKSEKSLKHLAIRVSATGQARQPNAEEPIISDQSNVEYQQNLCMRLARFTEVSVLWLGHVCSASKIVVNNSIQSDVLQLSLLTGVTELKTLTRLTELNITSTRHAVGVAEVRWMVKHWPKLKKLFGLDPNSEAFKWIKAEHPRIKLEELSSQN